MLFPTIEFGIFFIIVWVVSFLLRNNLYGKKIFLTIASYFFYGYWDFRFCFLLFFSSTINYIAGLLIEKLEKERVKKSVLIFSIVINLGILGFFKYYNFFISSFNNLIFKLGFTNGLPVLNIILPVGISFFTFQALSYVIDVYRKEIKASESLIDILLYISFFPQLVAGPIVRAKDFLPQLSQHTPTSIKYDRAFILITTGLFKKMIVANYLGSLLVDKVFDNPAEYASIELLFAVYGYAIQIYCDFSAYSDIAIGIAYLLGYEFPKNFNHPYRAESLQDFWRRWHISLSSWLKDYLYIPLGGSRNGKLNTYKNLLITMLLGGLWHGANWTFIIWGVLHGGFLAIERFFKEKFFNDVYHKKTLIVRIFQIAGIFHFVCFCWIFFRSNSLENVFSYLKGFLNFNKQITILSPFLLILIIGGIASQFVPEKFSDKVRGLFNRLPVIAQGIVLGIYFLGLSILSSEGVAPFIYFQF